MTALSSIRTLVGRHPVLIYYLLTFTLLALVVAALMVLGSGVSSPLQYAYIFMPTVVAVLLSGIENGWKGIGALLSKFLVWRVGIQWYLIALLSTTATGLAAIGLYVLAGGAAPAPNWLGAGTILLMAVQAPLGEEAGWRGYVLPRLQARMGALYAALIIGVIWGALFHLPLFLSGSYQQPFILYVLLVVAWSILFTWVYNNTHGSLLLAYLFHLATNVGGNIVGAMQPDVFPIFVALTCIVAIGVVALFGPQRLVRGEGHVEGTGLELNAPGLSMAQPARG